MLWANLNVGYHIWNILEDEELQADSVIKDSLITASDGKSYRTKLYNIDFRFLPQVAKTKRLESARIISRVSDMKQWTNKTKESENERKTRTNPNLFVW